MSHRGKTVPAHFTLHWFVIFLPFPTAFSATKNVFHSFLQFPLPTPFTFACWNCSDTYQIPSLPEKNTPKPQKNTVFWEVADRQTAFVKKPQIDALLENLVDHDRVYLCSLGDNTLSHSFLDNPLFLLYLYPQFFRHYQVWWLLSGIMTQPSNPSLQKPSTVIIHQVPKYLPLRLSTSGQKHFWRAVRNETGLWSGPHND